MREADLKFFAEAKAAGALLHLSDSRVREICQNAGGPTHDIIPVLCGDCDHSDDKIDHLRRVFPGIRSHRLHWNGGGLLLDACSPANELGYDCSGAMQFQVMQSLKIKAHIRQVIVETHWPCGVASDAGMTIRDQMRSLIHVKQHLKDRAFRELNRRIHVALLFHMYRADVPELEARRMYYVPMKVMTELLFPQDGLVTVS